MGPLRQSTAGSSICAAPLWRSGTWPPTSPAPCWTLEDSGPCYTLICDEPVEVWVMCSPHKLSRSTAGGAPRAGSPDAASIRSALIDEALELGLDLRQGLLERGLPILEFDP